MATAIDLVRASNGQPPAPDLAGDVQDWLDGCADMGAERVENFDLYRRFYEGDQSTELTDRLREFLETDGVRFRENFCEPMVDMVAERLTVEGFAVEIGDEEDESEASAQLVRWLDRSFWRANRLDATAGVVHTVALSRAEAFGIVGWDAGREQPTFAYNAPERMKVVYADDDPDRKLYAVKTWDTAEKGPSNPGGRPVVRMNVYHPDRIECWFKLHGSTGRGGWAKWRDAAVEGEPPAQWPRPWTDESGKPLGVPVVHFRNRPLGETTGRSELVNVVPMQLEINKQVLDLAAVLDNQGWAQRYVTGVDPTSASFVNAPGEVWVAQAKDATFGQFNNADITPILDSIEKVLSRIARRSGMPLHLLTTGAMPSGESIKASESRLVKRCRDRAVTFGNEWEDAARMAVRLAKAAGVDVPGPDDLDTVTIEVLWENPASEDEASEAATAAILQGIGVSKRTLLTRMGFDPDQEEANRRTEADEAMAAAQRFLDTGSDGIGASGSGDGNGANDGGGQAGE